jgi:hypothetical protein
VQGSINYPSDHTIPQNGSKGLIRIRAIIKDENGKARPATFDELWSSCVFELINMQNATAFIDSYNRAISGELLRSEYIRLNTELEYKASLKLAAFCREIWIPWSEQHDHRYDANAWDLDTPNDYNKWIQSNPYPYWEDYYDNEIAPYRKKLGIGKKSPCQPCVEPS